MIDNQLNIKADRNAGKEEHTADCIADMFFTVDLDIPFRRRGKNRDCAAVEALKRIVQSRGKFARNAIILTLFRGYGRQSDIVQVKDLCQSLKLVMPTKLLGYNPFVARSMLATCREGDI